MAQRSALEQDVIDLERAAREIFEKQLEIHRQLRKLFDLIFEKLNLDAGFGFDLIEIGVNYKSLENERVMSSSRKAETQQPLNSIFP
ncbi:hypothetical protein P4117_09695 [Pseudomonas aeruginosa]|nr:hypothetical protein [Pseudomonas aeruginosa]